MSNPHLCRHLANNEINSGTLGDGWTIGVNSATWEGNTNTLNFCNAGSMLVFSNIIFTFSEPEPAPATPIASGKK